MDVNLYDLPDEDPDGRLAWLGRDSLVMRLLDGLPGVDVRIVADPTLRQPREAGVTAPGGGSGVLSGEPLRDAAPAAHLAQQAD